MKRRELMSQTVAFEAWSSLRGARIDESLKRLQTDHVDLMQIHEILRMEDGDRCFAEGGAIEALEEAGVGLTKIVSFLVEDMLKENGGLYEKGPDWGSHVVVDGNLVTGQNPASSEAAAKELLKLL